MDHRQWRPSPSPSPRPIQGNNVCPTCLFSHLPFCPPPAPPLSAYHQPPFEFQFQFQGNPNHTHSSFQFQAQPFSTSYARPYPASNPNPNPNPNWDTQTFRPPYEHGNLGLGEGDRNFKRPRIDDYNQNPPLFNLAEDERRLKLIRDHGGADDLHYSYDGSRPVFPRIAAESSGAAAAGNNEMHNLQILNGQSQYSLHNHNHNQNGFPSNLGHVRGEKDAFALQYGQGQPKTSPYPLDPQQHIPHPLSEPSYFPRRDGHGGLHGNGNGMNAPYSEHMGSGDPNKLLPQPYATEHPVQLRHEVHVPSPDGSQTQVVVGQQDMSAAVSQRGMSKLNGGMVYHHPYPHPASSSNYAENVGQMEASRFFRGQPPLPSSPPPPLPLDPPINQSSHLKTHFSPPNKPASLFPVPVSSSAAAPSSYSPIPEAHSLTPPYFHSKPLPQFSTGFPLEDQSKQYLGDPQPFSLKRLSDEKPKFVDASRLFHHPHRTSRPDHFVIIFRGLPGSGKSYLAKMLRDLEVENGGDAPRIHSMDDYFMTEVEKVEDNDASKSSSSGRNKKPVMKKVMEYCYEPEMEEAYRSSMLKAFKKTVEEGVFTFIIVDDRNLRVADFAQFWATAKRSGYEVYILEATYKDPAGCAARNVHGFTQEDIEKMAVKWEEAPSLYLQLDVKSLFHGDDLKESRIQEVDMDMEDDLGDALPAVQGREAEKVVEPPVGDDASSLKDGKRWDAEGQHPTEVRELGKSKWSEDLGEDDIDQTEGMKGNINALSGLIHQYGKERKSVHWGDQVGKTGFSIGAARKVNTLSLVIGPGAGYNLNSNPLPEEESPTPRNSLEPKKHSIFEERIRAEHESFKAVFDRRRQRIGGLDVEED